MNDVIQILPCPNCRHVLLLPSGVSHDALLRCPECAGELILREALESCFGFWTVMEDPAPLNPIPDSTEVAGIEVGEEAEPVIAEDQLIDEELDEAAADRSAVDEAALVNDESPVAEFQSEPATPEPQPEKPDWSGFEPINYGSFERMRRKPRSPVWSMLQVVLGGVAAFPIALLLLWYVFDKDIACAGPWVGEYAPWIVPERFRPLDDEAVLAKRRPRPQRGASGLPQISTESNSGKISEESVEDDSVEYPVRIDGAATKGKAGNRSNMPGIQGTLGSLTNSGGTESAEDSSDDPESKNLRELIRSCESSLEQWREVVDGGENDLKPAANSLYTSLMMLANALREFPTERSQVTIICDAMQSVARNIKRNTDVQNVVTQGAAHYFDKYSPTMDKFPLAIIVDLVEVTEDPEFWILDVAGAAALTENVNTVFVPRMLAPSLNPGQQLLMLGEVKKTALGADQGAPTVHVFVASYLHAF